MQVKLLEVRDSGTFIPLLCIDVSEPENGAQNWLLRRCGYPSDGRPNIIVTDLNADGKPASNDPYHWGGRTYAVAHNYIIENWSSLFDGDVVDVEFILGETKSPKLSESGLVP